ncbi:MAG: sugar MFS transporter [Steroidobacteraceae bacterium]
MSTHVAASGPNGAEPAVSARPQDAQQLRLFVFALFFFFGGITSLNDVVIPKLKGLFTLSYAEVMLVQSAFFAAYFFISLPAAALVRRIGYIRAAVLGLVLMAAGCLLFIPASFSARFGMFLAALFVLAAGITVVQVVNNPLISMLGNPATAHSRLTFAQAFNSLGTTVFPYLGALLFLGSLSTVDPQTLRGAALAAYRFQETHVVARAYLGLAVGLAVLAALMWRLRNRLVEPHVKESGLRQALVLLRHTRFGYGALCIFLYVGAEVTIGSLMVSYLTQSSVLALSQRSAGKLVSLYWGGAMLGRFVSAYLLRVISPGKVLATSAAVVLVLLFTSAHSAGLLSGSTLLAVGLFNSLMFPTIFSLACEGLGPRAAEASGIICVAIVGGAVVPLLTGHTADLVGLKTALIVPACCYAGIVGFGLYARKPIPREQQAQGDMA